MLAPGEDDVFEQLSTLAAYDVHHHVAPDAALLGGGHSRSETTVLSTPASMTDA